MKKPIIFLFILAQFYCGAQDKSINDYKYVIVDNQYDFQNEANQYRHNELMVYLLEKYGFEAYRNNEILPLDLNRGLCNSLALKINKTGVFRVNLEVWLEDCAGNRLFTTQEGVGITKQNKKAYDEAIREAFLSFQDLNYQYNGGHYGLGLTSESSVQKELTNGTPVSTIEAVKPLPPKVEPRVTDQQETATIEETKKSKAVNKVESPKLENNKSKSIVYTDGLLEWRQVKNATTAQIYRSGKKIGYARKVATGDYIIYTDDFSGIAYVKKDILVMEFDIDQEPQTTILSLR
jgi:hypothetical protein